MSTTELHHATQGPGVVASARRRPLAIVAAVLFVALIATLVWTSRPEDYVTLSTGNASEDGTRAIAQILRAQGVDVRQSDTLAGARVTSPATSTLVIADSTFLADYQRDSIAEYPGDLVLVRPSQELLDDLDTGLRVTWSLDQEIVPAQCSDPDAQAAGEVQQLEEAVIAGARSTAETCFENGDGEAAYAVIDQGERRIAVLASWPTITNEHLDERGHAALGLRMLGRHPTVIWYVGDPFDPSTLTWSGSGDDGAAPPSELVANPDFLPPAFGPVMFMLGMTVAVAALWRARRFGRLVREPLPVEVRASEATRGRARLYRRAQASGRAAAAMRARAAMRMGRRLGVPRSAGSEALVSAVARAAQRDPRDVHRILYGDAPAGDAAFMSVIDELDTLESEVHRP
ncbi:DUF4350 domain-containing protein [Demequina activiva]|uniref:DUF4350 domain-containing protein n=1 Tax=Demequina activiva TaxID=1582364 RepID=A0A919Q578_9MICO|nr:DUF4350 domain-containing protein [Demequina activiva]GIG55397.1 hypothetical protein Dac01nite_21490 [Demequina activiva]